MTGIKNILFSLGNVAEDMITYLVNEVRYHVIIYDIKLRIINYLSRLYSLDVPEMEVAA